MKIRVLGAHNSETRNAKCVSLLIDDVLAIDAGGLTSCLDLSEQNRIKAILLTHKHFDHIKDIPSIAINFFIKGMSTVIYSTLDVYDTLINNLLNGTVYPKFFGIPETNQTLKYNAIEPGKIIKIENYSVLPVKMNHAETTVGYQITTKDNKVIFYTADTGKDLVHCWQQVSPQLLFVEVTFPNRQADFAVQSKHLTPEFLKNELVHFIDIKSYLPTIVAVHMTPELEYEIEAELEEIAKSLGILIKIAHEGMQIQI